MIGKVLARTKKLIAKFWVIAEYCHDCGHTTEAWTIDDRTWLAVVGRKHGDVFCLRCFDKRALGVGLNPIYQVTATNVPWRAIRNKRAKDQQ